MKNQKEKNKKGFWIGYVISILLCTLYLEIYKRTLLGWVLAAIAFLLFGLLHQKLVGLAWFGYNHYTWSEYMTAENRPAYLYYFTKDNGALGDWHSGELPYFYGNIPTNNKNYDASDLALSETIQQYLLQYIRTGDPNGNGLPAWTPYAEAPEQILSLDSEVKMIDNPHLDIFHVYDRYMEDQLQSLQ